MRAWLPANTPMTLTVAFGARSLSATRQANIALRRCSS
jgi:hypothetical protein